MGSGGHRRRDKGSRGHGRWDMGSGGWGEFIGQSAEEGCVVEER